MPKCFDCPAFPCHWHYYNEPEKLCSPEDRKPTKPTHKRLDALEKQVAELKKIIKNLKKSLDKPGTIG